MIFASLFPVRLAAHAEISRVRRIAGQIAPLASEVHGEGGPYDDNEGR